MVWARSRVGGEETRPGGSASAGSTPTLLARPSTGCVIARSISGRCPFSAGLASSAAAGATGAAAAGAGANPTAFAGLPGADAVDDAVDGRDDSVDDDEADLSAGSGPGPTREAPPRVGRM